MVKKGIWDVVDESECWKKTGAAPVSTRWVDRNKGTEEQPGVRSRIVARDFKGKGKDPELSKSYRPISITVTEYRIMTKAIQLQLQEVVQRLVGSTQMGYLTDQRYAHDNTLLLAELARRLNRPGEGGVAVQVDRTRQRLIACSGTSCTLHSKPTGFQASFAKS